MGKRKINISRDRKGTGKEREKKGKIEKSESYSKRNKYSEDEEQ